MKVYLAVVIVALLGHLAIAKLEDGECEGIHVILILYS